MMVQSCKSVTLLFINRVSFRPSFVERVVHLAGAAARFDENTMGSSPSSISIDVSSINIQREDDRQSKRKKKDGADQQQEEFDVMISYSHADKTTMLKLHGRLW